MVMPRMPIVGASQIRRRPITLANHLQLNFAPRRWLASVIMAERSCMPATLQLSGWARTSNSGVVVACSTLSATLPSAQRFSPL
jgi:hypothetical protein